MENYNRFIESLGPNYEASDVTQIYSPHIDHVLSEKEYASSMKYKNKNIAISGGYGTGKSSVIKTYIKDSKYKNKTLFITLGSYIEDPEKEKINEIEKSILQQIIYSKKAELFSFTRINRLDKTKEDVLSYSILLSLLTTFLISSSIYIFNTSKIDDIINMKYGMNFIISIILVLLFLISFIYYLLLGKFELSKVNIKIPNTISKTELETLTNEKKDSFLNENIDELISFFKNTEYEIIVFEDIDRLENKLNMFTKLKEINEIINSSIKDKTIRFMYAVSDTVFKNQEHRTKFFDVIIPIIPFNSIATSKDLLHDKLKGIIDIETSDLRTLGNFISNPRDVIDIVNEYKIFSSNIFTDSYEEKIKLLYLCTYKVLYPNRFDYIYHNKGIISYYLSAEFVDYVKKDYCSGREIIIKNEIKNLKSKQSKEREKYYSEFLKYFNKRIEEDNIEASDIVFYGKNNEIIITYEELTREHSNILLLNRDDLFAAVDKDNQYDEEDVFAYLPREVFFHQLNKTNYDEQINKKEHELLKLKPDLINFETLPYPIKLNSLENKIGNNALSEYKYNINDSISINVFEKVLIEKRILDSNTRRIITRRHDSILVESDERIVSAIINHESLPWNQHVQNPKEVLEELSDDFFALDYTNIKDLYLEIMKNNKISYYDKIFSGLTSAKLNFFKILEENNIHFLKKSHKINELWDFISEDEFEDDLVYYFLIKTIEDIEPKELSPNSFFYTVLQEYDDVLLYLEKKFDLVKDKISKFKIKFEKSVIFDKNCHNMIKLIYDNQMFSIDLNQIMSISNILQLNVNSKNLLETSYNNAKNIYESLISSFDETMVMLSESKIKQNDSERFLTFLINDLNLIPERFNNLIENEAVSFEDISFVDDKYYMYLMKNNKIIGSWENINKLFIENEFKLNPDIISLINENADKLAQEKIDFTSHKQLIVAINDSEQISDEVFEKLINSMLDGVNYTGIKLPLNRLKILIRYQKIRIDSIDNYKDVVTSVDLTNQEKALIIINSYNKIKNMILDEMNDSVLEEILKTEQLKAQNKIKFAFSYMDLIKKYEKLRVIIFNILLSKKVRTKTSNIMYILENTLSKGINQKIELYLNYLYLMEEYDIREILQAIDANFCNSILNKESHLYIDNKIKNVEFLSILKEKKLITDFYIRINKILISFKK